MDSVMLTVRIRRELRGLPVVKAEAEQLDGKKFYFDVGWFIEEGQYKGEWAFLPRDSKYPRLAPCWIASGDLTIDISENQMYRDTFKWYGLRDVKE